MRLLPILTASLLLVTATTSAAELKTYKFTSNFVDCVKSHESEKSEYSQSGLAESGLMNGRSKIPSGSIDGNYWSYMNCLTPAEGGTTSETLASAQTCDEIRFAVNGKRYYVPPSVEGKQIGLAGKFWTCRNGSWQTGSGTIQNPEGDDVTPPENEDKLACGTSTNMGFQGCAFNVTQKELGRDGNGRVRNRSHGSTISLFYGPDYGNYQATSQGSAVATCNDGSWSLDLNQTNCQALSCDIGEEVTWSGYQNGEQLSCEGDVSYGGNATAEPVPGGDLSPLFPTLSLAKLNTKIMEGNAQFACGVNGWKLISSTCRVKPADSLICRATTGGFRCE